MQGDLQAISQAALPVSFHPSDESVAPSDQDQHETPRCSCISISGKIGYGFHGKARKVDTFGTIASVEPIGDFDRPAVPDGIRDFANGAFLCRCLLQRQGNCRNDHEISNFQVEHCGGRPSMGEVSRAHVGLPLRPLSSVQPNRDRELNSVTSC